MHFEILVEDQSGKRALDILVPKIIGTSHTFVVHAYKGIGKIPTNMRDTHRASLRIFLDNLPKLLKGYGRTFSQWGDDYPAAVIVVCDLDDNCLSMFRQNLFNILSSCSPQPQTRFCFAIEEGEAWFLGDLPAVALAYPKMKTSVVMNYHNDEICGTWEKLADAVFPGGSPALSALGWQAVGAEKSRWAESISPHMIITANNSPSFCYFRDRMQELC